MDVNLPDGRVLRNVPDGTTRSQIIAKLKAAGEDVSWATPKLPTGAEMLAQETGPGEAFLVGAGRKTDQIIAGAKQLYLNMLGTKAEQDALAAEQAQKAEEFAPLQRERPFSTGFGGALPAMAVPGAGASYLGAFLAGAAPEALAYGSAEERLKRGLVGGGGGMAGRAIGSGLATILKPTGAGSKVSSEAMAAAERIGYKPLAGQATQNPALLNVENYLARTPGSSGTMQAINQANQGALNQAAAKSVGQVGAEVSPGILGAAEKTIGGEFNRLQGITSPKLGDDFFNSLVKIESANAARGSFRNPKIDGLLEKSLDLASKGNLSGAAYKEIRSELSSQANSAFKSEGGATLGQAFKTVRNALDDAAEKSLSPADQAAWQLAREQWGNFKTLTKGLVAEGGNVSPARVAAQLRAQGPGFRTGASEGLLADVARIGESFKGPLNPNSGNLLQAGTWGPLTVPANFAAAKIYTNPVVQKYLRDGVLDIGKNGELIVRATGVPLGVAQTKQLLGVE